MDNLTLVDGAVGTLSIQTYTAGLDLSKGGTYDWQLAASLKDNATGTAGTDFPQVQVTGGNLALGGASSFNVNFTQLNSGNTPGGANTNPFWNSSHIWSVLPVSASGTNTNGTDFATLTNATYPTGLFATQLNPDGKSIDLVYNEMNLTAGSASNTVLGTLTLTGSNGNYTKATLSAANATRGSVDIAGLNPPTDTPVMVLMDVRGTTAAIEQWYSELSGVQSGGPEGYTIVPATAADGPIPTGDTGFVLTFANLPGAGDRFINFDWTAGNQGVTLDQILLPAPEPGTLAIFALAAPAALLARRRRNPRFPNGPVDSASRA